MEFTFYLSLSRSSTKESKRMVRGLNKGGNNKRIVHKVGRHHFVFSEFKKGRETKMIVYKVVNFNQECKMSSLL